MANRRTFLSLCVFTLSAILTVVGFFILDEKVTVNISFQQKTEFISRELALFVPFAITVLSGLMYWKYGKVFGVDVDEKETKVGIKYLCFSVVGVLLILWVIINNVAIRKAF